MGSISKSNETSKAVFLEGRFLKLILQYFSATEPEIW
jgi:hypothetical protein